MSNYRRWLVQSALTTATAGGVLLVAPAAPASATGEALVRTGGIPLNVRSGPSATTQHLGTVPNGSRVSVTCYVIGQRIQGPVSNSSQWDRLLTGGYVAHAYLVGASIPPCSGSAATPKASPGRSATGGAGAGTPGTVTTGDNGLRLNLRQGPGTGFSQRGTVPNGTTLAIRCQVSGQWISGPHGASAEWDLLTSGVYVSHAYVRSGPVSRCPPGTAPTAAQVVAKVNPPTSDVTGAVRSQDGPVNVRSAPTTASAVITRLINGSPLVVSCSVTGQQVSGTVRATTQWNRLASGRYISHAYVVVNGAIPRCPGATPVGATPPTNAEFIASAVAPARQGFREYGVPASVTIGQSILESGWGRSELSTRYHNHFGITCYNGWYGKIATGCVQYPDQECTPYCRPILASFRTYASVGDSFRDHGLFLKTNSRYQPAFAHSDNPDRFLSEVRRAGYATSPTYVADIRRLMREYNLYQYDSR